jgi:hypothetical protein
MASSAWGGGRTTGRRENGAFAWQGNDMRHLGHVAPVLSELSRGMRGGVAPGTTGAQQLHVPQQQRPRRNRWGYEHAPGGSVTAAVLMTSGLFEGEASRPGGGGRRGKGSAVGTKRPAAVYNEADALIDNWDKKRQLEQVPRAVSLFRGVSRTSNICWGAKYSSKRIKRYVWWCWRGACACRARPLSKLTV